MSEWLTRTTPADLEIRSDGRSVYGTLVPFDTPTEISERGYSFTETFVAGAFAKLTADSASVGRVKLLGHHNATTNPLGRATELTETRSGLVGTFRVSKTQAGDEALELVKDGSLDGFSIGFRPVRDDWSTDHTSVVRREAQLREVSLVNYPAYSAATVAGVRTAFRSVSPEDAARRLSLLERL